VTGPSTRVALAVLAGVLSMALYGGQFVVSRWSLQRTLSPWDLAAVRFAVAGALMLPWLARYGFASAAGIGWGRAIVLGITVGAPYTLVLFSGLALAPAAHGAVIIPGATPLISAVLLRLLFGERVGPVRLAGLALILAGLVLVSWPSLSGGAGDVTWAGDLLFVVAGVLWALFTVAARAWGVDPMRATAVVWVLALAYLPVYGAVAGTGVFDAPRGELAFQALYQGVGVAILALVLYAQAIRTLGAGAASLFMPLIPVFGVLLAIPVLGEIPRPVQLGGMLAVSGGMALAARGSTAPARPETPA
jgi:drug/metabolite transporter (DMT)-like permease